MPITSRNYYRNYNTLEVDVVNIFGQLNIGAAGAVSSFSGGGIKSVTKEATAGQYTIELTDLFARILMAKFQSMAPGASLVGAIQLFETPATFQADVKADGKITIQCLDFAGAAVNPASGEAIMIDIKARQSKIGRYDK
jgi:hypothetical protein